MSQIKKLIIIFDDGSCETFDNSELSDAKYWIERRLEKSGKYATEAYLIPTEQQLDVKNIIGNYEERQAKYEREIAERKEKALFEQLKTKYGDV